MSPWLFGFLSVSTSTISTLVSHLPNSTWPRYHGFTMASPTIVFSVDFQPVMAMGYPSSPYVTALVPLVIISLVSSSACSSFSSRAPTLPLPLPPQFGLFCSSRTCFPWRGSNVTVMLNSLSCSVPVIAFIVIAWVLSFFVIVPEQCYACSLFI